MRGGSGRSDEQGWIIKRWLAVRMTERARLKDQGKEGSDRWNEIELLKNQITAIHQQRERGDLDGDAARSEIIFMLEEDTLFGISD